MKVLICHFSLYKKNGWGRTFEEAKGLVNLGHQVTLLCSIPGFGLFPRKYLVEGIKIIVFYDIIPQNLLTTGYGFLSLLSKVIYTSLHSYDICLSNSHRDSAYYPCATNRLFHRSKLVIEWWDNFKVKQERSLSVVKNIKNPITRLYHTIRGKRDLRREIETKLAADYVVSLSSVTSKRAEAIGVPSNKVRVIRGGCDVSHIQYSPYPAVENKLKRGIAEDCITFGFIGDGDQELPDIGVFLEALNEINSKYHIRFLNFGKPITKAQVINPELESIIQNCGWIDYYGDNSILSATDVFVLIKQDNIENQSGWPNKLGDYLACGRAVLANPYGEIIPFIKEWKPGIISVDYTKESIKSAIMGICERSIDIAGLGLRNYSVAYSNTWADKAKELESVFEELIQKQ